MLNTARINALQPQAKPKKYWDGKGLYLLVRLWRAWNVAGGRQRFCNRGVERGEPFNIGLTKMSPLVKNHR